MKVLSILALTAFSFAIPQMTARDYYNELLAAGQLNRFMDEYVCFPDDADAVNFMVTSKVESIAARMSHAGGDLDHSKELLREGGKGLIVETYYKGVSSSTNFYDPVDDQQETYTLT